MGAVAGYGIVKRRVERSVAWVECGGVSEWARQLGFLLCHRGHRVYLRATRKDDHIPEASILVQSVVARLMMLKRLDKEYGERCPSIYCKTSVARRNTRRTYAPVSSAVVSS